MNPITPVRRFWRLLRLYKTEIRQIYAYAIFIGLVNLTLPLGIQAIINYIQTGELTSSWVILVCFVLVGIAVTGILQVLQLRVVERIQQNLFARSAFTFAWRLPNISYLELDKTHAPELANRFFDTLTLQKGLPKILIDFSGSTFTILFGMILLTIYSPYFIILAIALVLLLWLIFKITGPRGLKTSLKESKYKYKLAYWLEEIARIGRTFKVNAGSNFHLNKTDDVSVNYIQSRESHFRVLISQFQFFVAFKVIVAAGLLVLGGLLVFTDQMNIGQFVAAEIVIILIINSVEKIMRITDNIYDVLTALEKIGYMTDLEMDEDVGKISFNPSKGLTISTNELKFGFPEDQTPIFEALSIRVPSGTHAVLQGDSGSGKTVLLQLLGGIYQPTGGEILVNDILLRNLKREDFFKHVGIAFTTNHLFEGTFLENITLGRKVKREVLEEVIYTLKLDQFLLKQPLGIDSEVDSGGRRMPRSIIQKVLIARVIVHQPKLLLLEDPLQFIDEEEKKHIIDYLLHEDREWTVVVVSDFHYWKEKCKATISLDK